MCTECSDDLQSSSELYQAITELPQPNRDTLAYLVLHLHRSSSLHYSTDDQTSILRPGRTARPIVTLYGSNDVFLCKEVPFGLEGWVTTFGGNMPPKLLK